MEGFLALVMFVVLVGFYITPSIVAFLTHRSHAAVITLVNLFTGFTIIGWMAALIWACVDRENPPSTVAISPASDSESGLQSRASTSKGDAISNGDASATVGRSGS